MKTSLILLWLLLFSSATTIVATIYFHILFESISQDYGKEYGTVQDLSHKLNQSQEQIRIMNEQIKLAAQREQALLARVSSEREASA